MYISFWEKGKWRFLDLAELPMEKPKIKKLYYSISEVSALTLLKPYVLRYWESEFPSLRPSKNRAGKRIYRSSDVEHILIIKKLLYENKFTIEGARKQLQFGQESEEFEEEAKNDKQKSLLEEIKISLKEIIDLLQGPT